MKSLVLYDEPGNALWANGYRRDGLSEQWFQVSAVNGSHYQGVTLTHDQAAELASFILDWLANFASTSTSTKQP